MALRFLLLVALIGSSRAGPIGIGESQDACASECLVSDAQKLSFVPGKTYLYAYEGHSRVTQHGVSPPAVSSLQWKAEVLLSWVKPCQVAISIKRPVLNGHSDDSIINRLLTEKPMMATIKDGLVTAVCADQDDHPSSLNLKKGVLSSLQNVLPEISSSIVNKTFMELDVMGRCPTVYSVEDASSKLVVYKKKNHKECTQKDESPEENPFTSWWMKAPIKPINESRSECTQTIRKADKIIESVQCRDVNYVKISLPPHHLSAVQESSLKLIKVVEGILAPNPRSVRYTNLTFEAIPQPLTKEVVPEVKQLLHKLCKGTERHVEKETAHQLSKLISLLHRVPQEMFKQILSDIRSGAFCKNHSRLESIYLDSVSFVGNPGAVELMVDEVLSDKVSGGRTVMYTIGLHLLRKPCIKSVEAVSPLFDSSKVPSSMVLAAGSLVRRHCRFYQQCLDESPVRNILEKLASKLDSTCQLTSSNQERKTEALKILKAIGNIANITESVKTSVQRCAESEEADTYVRVAATQAFRQVSCQRMPTSELVKMSLRSSEHTEVRIASYVAAIRCASYEQAEKIVQKISSESNTQVRAFVLSHLRNLQKSDAPYLRGLRYNLTSFIIPDDYEKDIRKYSRSIDMSYYLPSLGVGAGVETSVIYKPGSYIPTQVQTNLTANVFDNILNIGEFGIRSEYLESIIDMVLGSDYIRKVSSSRRENDFASHYGKLGKNLLTNLMSEALTAHKRYQNSDDENARRTKSSEMLNLVKSRRSESKSPTIDAFARIFGKEVEFASFAPDFERMNLDALSDKVLQTIGKIILGISDMKINSARAVHASVVSFIPTVQGVPLEIKNTLTGVGSLEFNNSLNLDRDKVKTIQPTFSLNVKSFIGFNLGAKSGLRCKVDVLLKPHNEYALTLTKQKIEVIMDMPSKVKALDFEAKTYMMTKMPSKEDQRLTRVLQDSIIKKSCSPTLKSAIGLDACWDIRLPDYSKQNVFPLGDIKISVEFEKRNPQKPILKARAEIKGEAERKELDLSWELPGSSSAKKGQVAAEYKKESDVRSVKILKKGSSGDVKAVQLSLKARRASSGGLVSLTGYYSKQKSISSSDEVLFVKLQGGREDSKLKAQFDLKTKAALARYVAAEIEVDIATRGSRYAQIFTRGIDVRKCEAKVEIPGVIETMNYIRKKAGGERAEYRILSHTQTPSRELLKVEGKGESKGQISRETLESRLQMAVKTPVSDCESETGLVWTRQVKQAFVSLKRRSQTRPHFLFNISSIKEEESSYATKLELQASALIPHYLVQGKVQERSRNGYNLKFDIKKQNEKMYEVEGPLNLEMSLSRLRENAELKIRDIRSSKEHLLKTRLTLTSARKNVLVDWKTNGESRIVVEGEMEHEGESALSSSIALKIPRVVDAKLKIEKSDSLMQAALNGFIRPNTPESNRFKASSSVDYSQKEIQATLGYDLDKEHQMIKLVSNYNYDYSQKSASLRGKLEASEKTYTYNMYGKLGAFSLDPSSKNELSVRISKPSGEEMKLETSYRLSCEEGSESVVWKGLIQASPDRIYRVESDVSYNMQQAPSKMQLKGQAKLDTPSLKNVRVEVDSELDATASSQEARYMIEIAGANLEAPTKLEFNWQNREDSLKADVDMKLGSAPTLRVKGSAKVAKERNSIGDSSVDIELELPNSRRYKIGAEKDSQKASGSLSVGGKDVLSLVVSMAGQESWTAKITTPTRITEARSSLTKSTISLSLFPNRRQSEEKYEVNGHYRTSSSHMDAGAQLKYPGQEGRLEATALLDVSDSSSTGMIELDVFKSSEDKITVAVRTIKRAERSYKVEADMKIPTRNMSPRVIFNVALSPEVKNFEVVVKESPSAKPSYECQLALNNAAYRSKNLYAKLRTPADEIEIISTLQAHELIQCRGSSLNGTLVSRKHGSYDFASAWCAPGYIEMGAKKSSQDKMFIAKLGMKNPSSLKIALDLVYNSSKAITTKSAKKMVPTLNLYGRHEYLPKIPMLLVGAKLWSPMIVSVDAYYNATGLEEFEAECIKPLRRGLKTFSSDVEKVLPSFGELSPKLVDDVRRVKENICEETKALLNNIGLSLPSIEEVEEFFRDAKRKIYKSSRDIKEKVEQVMEKATGVTFEDVHKSLKAADRYIKSVAADAKRKSLEFISAIQNGREAMMQIPTLRWVIETVEGNSIWNWFKHALENVEEFVSKNFYEMKKLFHHYYRAIQKEVHYLWRELTENTVVRRIIKWVESWFEENDDTDDDDEDSTLLGALVTKFLGFYATPKTGLLRFQVPLRRPVSSLSAAVPSVGISLPSSSRLRRQYNDPSTIYMELLQPYRRHAMLGVKQAVTFDGLVVPLVSSNCDILLAKVMGDKITLQRRHIGDNVVKVSLKSGKHFTIHLTLVSNPQIPILKSSRHMKLQGAEIKKLSEGQFVIELEAFTLKVRDNRLEVEAKPQAFAKIEGLMGNHDGERGNDAHPDSTVKYYPRSEEGIHHLSKDSAKRLFEKYRLDSSCPIPSPRSY